ncbi:hypothetical protein RB595_001669 [Gaeumannomyces hyphopodioides]
MDPGKDPNTATEPHKRPNTRMIKANRNTPAARLNKKVFEGLRKALHRNPEIDLISILGSRYSDQLLNFKKYTGKPGKLKLQPPPGTVYFSDIRQTISQSDNVSVVSELSLWGAITRLLNRGEVVYEGVCALSVVVVRVSETMVAKVAPDEFMSNEFRSLLYLEQHLPAFPAPRLHGVVRFGKTYVQFTTFIPGLDLEKAWPQLKDAQKRSLSGQLDALLITLRSSLPHPPGTPLGGLGGPSGAPGEGCKDHRRGSRLSKEPIFTVDQFEDFIFSGVRFTTPIYVDFLRGLKSLSTPAKVVFTHGDFRPANIMVDKDKNGIWRVVSIVDWDTSGFYPEYWESVKMTNNLGSCETFDWYRYLPDSVSPRHHNLNWCIDRVLDPSLENSF